ncbi:hypothetical protein LX36DRAFT_661579 [Colletotrichum falcatum]|nr:hypothetical protein LX36DRAFT_661579 [Colletotrichum falcatum]
MWSLGAFLLLSCLQDVCRDRSASSEVEGLVDVALYDGAAAVGYDDAFSLTRHQPEKAVGVQSDAWDGLPSLSGCWGS